MLSMLTMAIPDNGL